MKLMKLMKTLKIANVSVGRISAEVNQDGNWSQSTAVSVKQTAPISLAGCVKRNPGGVGVGVGGKM